ncbi:MAG TPA: 2-amino-4-hydroxy-6-hydroxymethyldihydropteridine diphosphokinase [Planctomycetota bacterium]|nr:2-amino-4-hydroxy-6-hydroxymethyldihydropteridine diphosphokinase [Planctomycetota bacterium]
MEHTAFIGLGANLGERGTTLRRALEMLNARDGIRVQKVSAFIETKAVGGPPGQPDYLNGAAQLSTNLSPRELLAALLDVERALGRDRSSQERNLPRTIDLDLLLYDDLVIDEPDLRVPHPRLHERAFVLIPLAEIAPEARHPVLGKSIGELACSAS